jgi:metal-responsive CopG/Arc/MetJ family transcriptional regulator
LSDPELFLPLAVGSTMKESITISIPSELRKELDKEMKQEGLSRSAIVAGALRKYLTIRKLRAINKRMSAKARAQGIYTDEDVFDHLS